MNTNIEYILEINDLSVSTEGSKILDGLNLSIRMGETHAIMGPNGSGKSTLAKTIAGHTDYKVINGAIKFLGEDLLSIPIEERSNLGLFLGFQYPIEIPGVNTNNFLKTSLNSILKAKGDKEVDTLAFLKLVKEKSSELGIDEKILSRQLNVGFSGGEKKKNEILQMKILNPNLSILDETDSGLDIDALKIIAKGVNSSRSEKKSFLVITHYQRLLNYIKPDFVHVLSDGKIVKTGCSELAEELEKTGYKKLN